MDIKKIKIMFWISTIIIFLFEGILPALTFQTEFAKEGIRHLGYPDYFGVILVVFKVLGTLTLIIPKVPSRIKEWAYTGFGFDFIFAFVSIIAVDGFGAMALFPLFFLGILVASYICYHKLTKNKLLPQVK